ncbi:anthranilate synthase family protein [Streptacidiphilus sp. N1-12]|uniref:anthranilate synthase n=2 Tax=Streptacidiphilus alkalitolerans TaxID=3342712 RepID=A0ABV6WL10_9ACTN
MTPDPLDPLDRVLGPQPPAYALLHRPEANGPGLVDLLVGEVSTADTLAELPVPDRPSGAGPHELLVLVPYRQIAERGFTAPDDGEPLLVMSVSGQRLLPLAELLARLPQGPPDIGAGAFDTDDETYAGLVRRIVSEEIGRGEGANFVLRRSFVAELTGSPLRSALALYRRLLTAESGAYWTFLVHTGDRILVGASPERHLSLAGGTAVMNPISGTYCYPPEGPTLGGVLDFLADRKEVGELYMVVDEELKMMARICEGGGRASGPFLKEMGRVAHTEYFIEGRTERDVREILRETLFAPTVTGSPLESACRVIARHEPAGRGYYGGVAALIGRDALGGRRLDSAILIRTADFHGGAVRIGVGATLVRDSDPWAEAAETRAKAAGLLDPPAGPPAPRFAEHPRVRAALAARNRGISDYWLARRRPLPTATAAASELAGRRVLVVDAEDTFTAMMADQLTSLGLDVTVRRFDEPYSVQEFDLVVLGPGPGDPRECSSPKVSRLRETMRTLLDQGRPFLAICLSHQVLASMLGLDLVRRDVPMQGAQREIDLFGRTERVGFYNTFAARSDRDRVRSDRYGPVEVSRDPVDGEVHALRGRGFASMQFHAESVLTVDGVRIVSALITEVWESCMLLSAGGI